MLAAANILRTNWQKRQVVSDLIARDFRLRYLGSILGRLWNVFVPLAMIAIYTFVFSVVMQAKLGGVSDTGRFAYVIFLCSGLLPWNAFVETVNRGTNVFLDNAHLIKKVAFPMEVLPAIVAGSTTINFLISFCVYVIVILGTGHGISWTIFLVPVAYVLQLFFALGLAMFFSVFNVFFRDVQQLVSILFMTWFWVTPIVYEMERVPEAFRWIVYLNPFYYFVNLYQHALFYKTMPEGWTFLTAVGLAALSFLIGSFVLCRFKGDIPDEI